MDNIKSAKNTKIKKEYSCEKCEFLTHRKVDYNRHILTAKHKKLIEDNIKSTENTFSIKCNCGKEYKNRHNLSRHKKNCTYKPIEEPNNLVQDNPFNDTKFVIDIILPAFVYPSDPLPNIDILPLISI